MDKKSVNSFAIKQRNAFYFSKGPFNPKTIPVIISEVGKMILGIGSSTKLAGKIKLILIECLQNAFIHGLENVQETFSIEIFKEEENYIICIENQVGFVKIVSLKDSLDYIKSLSKQEVENHYLRILNTGQLSQNGGAGLGLITIAKLSNQNFKYDFQPNGLNSSNFKFQVMIS
ncbi:MAG: hypothetical protein H0X62_09190 [Bacteroidetes bacterium]|nr:hypothetical protein [Bacteroidota bacterium]